MQSASDEITPKQFESHGVTAPGKRLRSLDGLRGVAILLVLAFHTLRVTGQESLFGRALNRFQESAWAGVDLFFVLSGFLITGILLDTRDRRNYFTTFFARRTLRIFPLYYAVLVVALLIVPAILGSSHLPSLYPRLLANQFWLWTYTANYLQATGAHTLPGFGHFWSLAIEEQFYWFWPVAVYFLSRKRLFQVIAAVCLLSPAIRFMMESGGIKEWAIRQYTFTRMDALLIGGLVALLVREPQLYAKWRRAIQAVIAASVASLLVIAARNSYLPYEADETVVLGYSCLGVLFAAIVYRIVTSPGQSAELLASSPLRWLGRYSYGIYMFHWPIAQAYRAAIEPKLASLTKSFFLPAEFAFAIVTIVSAVVAWMSWHLFEARFLRLKDHFTYSTEPREENSRLSPAMADLAVVTRSR